MKIRKKLLTTITIAMFASASVAAFADQTLSRLFSYDPHPSTAEFAESIPFSGKLAKLQVKFIEKWEAKGDNANIKEIAFEFSALKGGKELQKATLAPKALSPNSIKPGQEIGETRLGETSIKAKIDSFEKDKSGITDITITFTANYSDEAMKTAKIAEVPAGPAGTALGLAERFYQKALTIDDKHVKAKIGLLKKSLGIAPAPNTSPSAQAFHNKVNTLIETLNKGEKKNKLIGKTPTKIGIPDSKPIGKSIKIPLVQKPVISKVSSDAIEEAKSLVSNGKQDQALKKLEALLKKNPELFEANLLAGSIELDNRSYARAKTFFEKAIDNNPASLDANLKYFKSVYYLGEGQKGLKKLEELYSTDKSYENGMALAKSYFQYGDFPNARKLCNNLLLKNPEATEVTNLLNQITSLSK